MSATTWGRCLGPMALAVLFALVTPVSVHAQETIEYYGTDHLGSVRVVFDASGALLGRSDYLPYGEELATTGSLPAQKFTGQARDAEAGQDYFHARMYQPRTGRFNAVDPVYAGLFDPQQWNRYAYARNNPLVFVDPTGMATQTVRTGCTQSGGAYYCPGDITIAGPSYIPGETMASVGYQAGRELNMAAGSWDAGMQAQAQQYYIDGRTATSGRLISQEVAQSPAAVGLALGLASADTPVVIGPGDVLGLAVLVASYLWELANEVSRPYPGNDPLVGPEGFVWKGSGPPGSGKGNWHHPGTGESLHPDLGHAPPIGPHWDWHAPNGKDYRIFPDGTISPK